MNLTKPRTNPSRSRQVSYAPAARPGPVMPLSLAPTGRPGGVDCSRRHPRVRLNGQWEQFTAPKRDLIMLGTVQCGLEIGALARTPQGAYLQINGSVIRELNRSRIKAAIERATRELSARLARDAALLLDAPPRRASALAPHGRGKLRLTFMCETTAGFAREDASGEAASDAA